MQAIIAAGTAIGKWAAGISAGTWVKGIGVAASLATSAYSMYQQSRSITDMYYGGGEYGDIAEHYRRLSEEATKVAEQNAAMIRSELSEEERRATAEHEEEISRMRAIRASSGILFGEDDPYIIGMQDEFGRQIDWMRKAAESRVSEVLRQGQMQAQQYLVESGLYEGKGKAAQQEAMSKLPSLFQSGSNLFTAVQGAASMFGSSTNTKALGAGIGAAGSFSYKSLGAGIGWAK